MGRYLRRQKLIPEFVLCSAAARARETWELASTQLKSKVALEISERLYLATPQQTLDLVHQLPAKAATALLVGHNPCMQALAVMLIASADGATRSRRQHLRGSIWRASAGAASPWAWASFSASSCRAISTEAPIA